MESGPSHVGPYELVERLGAGGMAETFVALRRGPAGFEQRVCLKRILPGRGRDEEFVRLFLEEARIAARLRHANVVSVLDFGEADDAYFLVLELVDGVDLRGLLRDLAARKETLDASLVVHLAIELGAALEHAHTPDPQTQRGAIVHRDISPSNVLLSTAGEVKLADFGIAKAEERTRVTRTGVSRGKVPYMAPEYALEGRYDPRADLFSLGVTLYECLTGRRPFDGATDVDTVRRASSGEHVPLGLASPHVPEALATAVEQLLQPDPEARPPRGSALIEALVGVAPPPTAERVLGALVRRALAARPSPGSAGKVDAAKADGGTPRRRAAAGRDAPRVAGPDAVTRTASHADAVELAPAPSAESADTTRRRPRPEAVLRWPNAGSSPPTARDTGGAGTARRGPSRALVALALLAGVSVAVAWGAQRWRADAPEAEPGATRTDGAAAAALPRFETDVAANQLAPTAGPDHASDTAPPARVAEPHQDPSAVPARPPGGDAPAHDAPKHDAPTAPAPERAALRVVVLPHGEVSLDGGRRRVAPVEYRRLRPGRHRIEVYREGALIDRSWVVLAPGERAELNLP